MKLFKEWHSQNVMPKNASFKERVKWHLWHKEIVIADQYLKNF